jgi:hypothetical protein
MHHDPLHDEGLDLRDGAKVPRRSEIDDGGEPLSTSREVSLTTRRRDRQGTACLGLRCEFLREMTLWLRSSRPVTSE